LNNPSFVKVIPNDGNHFWRGMKDLRNALIHGYANVDLDEVWRIAHTDVPELYRQLVALKRESEEERES